MFISATDASNVIAPVMIDNQISDFKMNLNNGAQKMTDEKQPVSKSKYTFIILYLFNINFFEYYAFCLK